MKQTPPPIINIDASASIREVYEISTRIEGKIDRYISDSDKRFSTIEQRLANIEGRSAIIAIAWSTAVTVTGALVEVFLRLYKP